MKLTKNYSYPADVEQVFALVSSQEFREEACVAQHATSHAVSVETEGDTTVVRIERSVPAELPDFVKRLTGDTVSVVQVERWSAPAADGSRSAVVSVDIVGQPASMKGSATLKNVGSGAAFDIDGDVKVSIPLLGRKIEPEVAKAISASLDAEVELGTTKL